MSAPHKPEWSGLTIETANERHILPLYEPDLHETFPGTTCPCGPEVTGPFWRAEPHAPQYTLYRHNNLKHQQ